jgi:lipopolysaccharide transport system ATP-binding protein
MSEAIITVEGLGKKYRIQHNVERQRYTALRDVIANKFTGLFQMQKAESERRNSTEDFWALKNVSFGVKQGEVVGIIGRNGAGKSTLLKILSRITEPTTGEVRLRGRVASLLEVGTGFHPELTGRENIFLNGAILGMSRVEIRSKFDEIVAFAEVEKFLDTPVKRYSSGMYVRLAFAVAAHLEPEILIVDEVLAVGDIAFQQKCLGKMHDVASQGGRTVLFVSHNMQSVRELCNRVILLRQGQKDSEGEVDEIIGLYTQIAQRTESLQNLKDRIKELPTDSAFRLQAVEIIQDGRSSLELTTGKPFQIKIAYEVFENSTGLHVYILLRDMDGSLIFESLHNGASEELPFVAKGRYVSTVTIPENFLAGKYYELQIQASIHCVRAFFPNPLSIQICLNHTGMVNQAYPGYSTPGKIAPLLAWETTCSPTK